MDIRTLRLSVTNDYLVKTGRGYLLVDTGYAYEWGRFCRTLSAAGVRLSDVSHILITHHHDDHCGLLVKIVEENERTRVVMSHRSAGLLEKGENDHSHGGGYVNKRVAALLSLKAKLDKRWTHKFAAYASRAKDILVAGDTTLQEIGIDLPGKILETPGHTVDSISVVFDDGDCIAGDAAANFLQFAGTKYCVIYIEDIYQYYDSWKRLLSAGASRILPSHGRAFKAKRLMQHMHRNRRDQMVMLS